MTKPNKDLITSTGEMMNQKELKNTLELHRKWIMNEADGKRANLRSADLRYADLRSANLSSANLRSANLSSANLRFANLSSANLRFANLNSANLRFADLSSADLRYADLRFANFRSANLSSANLRYIIRDFYAVLALAKDEVIGLYDSIIRGKIDGKIYEGECACLIGTIAKLRKENYQELGIDLKPESDRLIEKWFLGISKGDNPDNNPISLLTAEWMRDWMKDNEIIIPQYKLISSIEKPDLF